MNPKNCEDKRHAFDSFCKKILKNEARDYYKAIKRQVEREILFSELSEHELEQLSTMDSYFEIERTFNVLGCEIIVVDELIAELLQKLPEHKRNIILLSYFLGMTDREIGAKLDLIRTTVQYQRASTLQKLKKLMEVEMFDESKKIDKK